MPIIASVIPQLSTDIYYGPSLFNYRLTHLRLKVISKRAVVVLNNAQIASCLVALHALKQCPTESGLSWKSLQISELISPFLGELHMVG